MAAKPWTYESWDERRTRDRSEFDVLASNALESISDPDPMAMQSASQALQTRASRDQQAEQRRAVRQRIRDRVATRVQEDDSPRFGGLGAIGNAVREVGGAALEGLDRVRHAGLGFATGDNPVESVEQAVEGLRGEKFSGEDLGFIRHLPEGRTRTVAGRIGEEFVDPLNYLIALKGPVLAARITGRGISSRAARMILEPMVTGGPGRRLIGEGLGSAAARGAGEAAVSALPEDTPGGIKAAVGLGAGVLGASAAGAGMSATRRTARLANEALGDAPEGYVDPSRRGTLRSEIIPGAGGPETPTQGGLEGVALDKPTFRPENARDETQLGLGIGSGTRPVEDLPMFAPRAEDVGSGSALTDAVAETGTGIVPQRDVITSQAFDTDALPEIPRFEKRLTDLRGRLATTPSGEYSTSKANRLLLRQIGELEAAADVRRALDANGGDPWKALEEVEDFARELSDAIEYRDTDMRGGRRRQATFGSAERAAEDAARRADEASINRTSATPRGTSEARFLSEDIGQLDARLETLMKFLDTAGLEVRVGEPNRRGFANRYGIDLEARIETPEQEALREATAVAMRMARAAGIDVDEQMAARVAAGDQIAMKGLQKEINDARARQGKPDIRLKQTIEQTRERRIATRVSAEESLARVDMGDSAVVSALVEELGIRDITPAAKKRLDAGTRLTAPQQVRIRRQIESAIERMTPDDREALFRDAGVAEISSTPDPAAVEQILEAQGFTNQNGLMLAGPAGDAASQARAQLPADSLAVRLADGDRAGTEEGFANAGGGALPPPASPPAPPGSPPPGGRGGAPGGSTPAGGRPPRGMASIDDAIAKTDEELRAAGGISRAVDALANRLPGGTSTVRTVRAALNPIQNHVRRVMVAYNAEGNTYAQLATAHKARKLAALRQIQAVWDEAPPRYHGPTDNDYRGLLVDYFENPAWYDAGDDLAAATRALGDGDLDMVRDLRANWNVDVEPFIPQREGAIYVTHMTKRAGPEEAFTQTRDRLAASGRRKHRVYETMYERQKAAEARGEKVELETDPDALMIHHAEAMARMAAQEVFVRGTGGRTKVQVIEQIRPGVGRARMLEQQRLANLDARMKTAMNQGRVEAALTRNIDSKMTRQERRAESLMPRMREIGYEGGTARLSEWGPELSHIAGQMREIGLDWRHLRAELLKRGEKLADIEARHADLLADYELTARHLEQLTKAYERPLPPEWAQSTRTLRYHPAEEAAAIDTLHRSTRDTPGLGRIQTGMEHWRSTVTSLDATFATVHGMFASLMDPVLTARTAGASLEAFRNPEFMLDVARREPEMVTEFARSSGFEWPTASREAVGGELGTNRGLEAIRYKGVGEKIQDFNDRQWRMVTYRLYEQWKKDRDALIEFGVKPNVASAEAANVLYQIVPRMNTRRSGRSQSHAEFERMLVISPSFLYQPLSMIKDFASGIIKIGAARGMHGEGWATLMPRERLAVKRYGTMAATIAGMSATSAMLSAPFNNQDPLDALAEVMNPMSGKFMSLVVGDKGTIALGSAHRTAIRALFPRTNADGETDLLGGVTQMLKGKQHPAIRSVIDQFKGEDFYGQSIEEGPLPGGLANRLWYAAEMGMPIWTQPISQAARGSKSAPDSITEGILQAAFGTLGYSYYERSAFESFDRIARGRYGMAYHDLPPKDQVEIREEFPDLWAASIRHGREQRAQYQAQLDVVRSEQMESDRQLLTGEQTREGWLNQYRQRQQQLAGYREAIFAASPQSERNTPLDRYFEQISLSELPDGSIDWDSIDAWKASLPVADQEYIEANTGVSRTVMGRVYRNVSQLYGEYLDLPKYRGFDADQAREIDQTWQTVRNRAEELAGGQEPEKMHMLMAYRELQPRFDVEADILKGVQYRVLGFLPKTKERETFRAANPDIDLFYGRGSLTDLERERVATLAQDTMRAHEDDVVRDLASSMNLSIPALQPASQGDVRARIRARAAARARG